MMKAVIVLAAFVMCFALIHADKLTKEEAKAKWTELGKKCAEEVGASEEELAALHKKELPETKNGKCVLACVYKKVDVIKDGKYSSEGFITSAKTVFDEESAEFEKIKNVAETCEKEVGEVEDECELAAKIMKCKHQIIIELAL